MSEWRIAAPGRLEKGPSRRRPPAGSTSVLVQVERLTLCGTDFGLFAGTYGGPTRYPIRFGHEWSGRVVEAPGSSRLSSGDRVTGDCSRWCGACEPCSKNRNLCRHIEKFGISCDGFATSQRWVEERHLYRAPARLSSELLALSEIFAVALMGLDRLPLAGGVQGQALVVGGGPLGLATWLCLRWTHPGLEVRLLERTPERRDLLRRLFPEMQLLDGTRDNGSADLSPTTYEQIRRTARFDVVVDCSGTAAGLDAALGRAAVAGTVLCLGLGAAAGRLADLVVLKALTVIGSIGGTGAFPRAMELLQRHGDMAARLITHRFPFESAPRAFATLNDPQRLKVQLRM